MQRVISLVISLVLIVSLITQAFASEKMDIDVEGSIVTIINENVLAKKEVIDYWLRRMIVGYKPSTLQSYIITQPTTDEMIDEANRISLILKECGLSNQEIRKFVRDNRYNFAMYTVDSLYGSVPKFSIYLNTNDVIRESYPEANLSIDVYDVKNRASEFYSSVEVSQSELYSMIKDYEKGSIIKLGKLSNPLKNTQPEKILSSSFGGRDDIVFGGANVNNHTGIDLAMPAGTDICSAHSGVVLKVVYSDWGYGRYVVVDSGGYATLYGHCSEIYVREGQTVSTGDKIAEVGSTGWSTGNHLHFEIIDDGVPIDPLKYIV